MASKLGAKVKEVSDLVDELEKAAMEFLKYRIQFGTMVEQVIPKAKKNGTEQGYTVETAIKAARELKTKRLNTALWGDHFIKALRGKILELQQMLDAYDPAVMKKSGPVADPQKVQARTALKAMAIGLVVKAKELIVDVDKMLRA